MRSRWLRCLGVLVLLISGSLAAQQITLVAKQGADWSSQLKLPALQVMSFRWSWTGGQTPASAEWQVTRVPNQPLLKNHGILVPPTSPAYTEFAITPGDLAFPNLNSFYVRVRTPTVSSAWLQVTIGNPARQAQPKPPSPGDVIKGKGSDPTRKADPGTDALKGAFPPDLTCSVQAVVVDGSGLVGADPATWLMAHIHSDDWKGDKASLDAPVRYPTIGYKVTVSNLGQGAADDASVLLLSRNDGAQDLLSPQKVFVGAGQLGVRFFVSRRAADWQVGTNSVSAVVTLDGANVLKESREDNNQCSVQFTVIVPK